MTGRRRKILGWLAVVVAALVAIGVAARELAPPWLHGAIERTATRTLGRELSIAGPFDLSFSPTPTLTAGDVTLANASWGSEPAMVRARHLRIVFDLASLWSGPVRVHELELDGARLLLERDGTGQANWELALPPRPPRARTEPPVEIERATLRDFELDYRSAPDAEPLTLAVERIAAALDPPSRMIDLEGSGHFDEAPWELSGRIGTLEALLAGHDLDQTLSVRFGESKIELRGRVRDPLILGGPDVEIGVEGPDLEMALERFGVRTALTGAFRLRGRLTPADDGVGVEAEGVVGDVTASAKGVVNALLTADRLDLRIEAGGPDAAAVGSWLGLRNLPRAKFELAGRLLRHSDGLAIEAAELRIQETRILATGALGHLPRLAELNLAVEAEGRDASRVGAWLGVKGVPPRSFELAGRVRRDGDRIFLDDVSTRVGTTSLRVAGELGTAPRLVGTDLSVQARGDDLSELAALTRLRLPAAEFEVEGRLLRRSDGFAIEAAELRSNQTRVRATGGLGLPRDLRRLELEVEASGPDLGLFSGLVGADLPRRSFEVRGDVARDGRTLALDAVEGRLDDVAVSASGRLVLARRVEGSDLRLRVAGPDLTSLATVVGWSGAPAEPFDAKGRLRIGPDGYDFEELEAAVSRIRAAGSGRIGAPSARDGSSFSGQVSGEALSDLAAWGLPESLPADPFTIDGRLTIEEDVYRLESVDATLGADRARVDGVLDVLGGVPDQPGLDLVVELSGPRLSELSRFSAVAGIETFPDLPADSYLVAGRVRRVAAGYELHELRTEAGRSNLLLNGTIGSGKELRGTDLRIDAEAPDTSLLSALFDRPLPAGPLEIHGRLARGDASLVSDGLTVAIGELRGRASGTLGDRPELEGTELRIDLSGPDFAAAFGSLTGRQNLPAEPFELSMELAGRAGELASKSFSARLGANDLSGRLAARFEGKTQIDADLRSQRLDLSTLFVKDGAETTDEGTTLAETKESTRDRLIPDQPLSFAALDKLDATVRFEAAELVVPGPARREVVLAGTLKDGVLRVERFEGSGILGGRTRASLELEPTEKGYRLHISGEVDEGRLVVTEAQESRESAPTVDLEVDLRGEGRSLREIAASSSGHALVVAGAGRIQFRPEAQRSKNPIRQILEALLPFRSTADHADVECGIALALVTGGEAEVEPIAMRTDKVSVTGIGWIDLATEEIDLSWRVKERNITKISAGELVNSYIKLGGTLASPNVELKPLEALTSVGAAVATGGLTTVSKGIWNRLTAGEKVCARALRNARQRLEERDAPAGP